MDNTLKELTPEERKKRREDSVKPLVEAYFAWVKEKKKDGRIAEKSKTGKGLSYAFHEIFMRFVAYRLLKNSLQHTLFQIGEPVIKYKESGSIMDWIKYIKENKRKRK